MGGFGSGLHGRQGRKLGGHNSPESCARASEAMKEHHRRKMRDRPKHCAECGAKTARSDLEWFQKRWICGDCLNAGVEPLTLADFMFSQVESLFERSSVNVDIPNAGARFG